MLVGLLQPPALPNQQQQHSSRMESEGQQVNEWMHGCRAGGKGSR
eukprot:SAG22_NODE_2042_length_3090_cov_9.718823_2_plen_45_part_00